MDSTKKNSYELLSMSDSDSNDIPSQIPELNFKSPRRKRLRKKLPTYRHYRQYDEVQNQKCCHPFGKYMSLSLIIVILCCWLLILSWLVVIFNDELKRFDNNLMIDLANESFTMDTVRINVPVRLPDNVMGKKMRKRRELDALVASNELKRYSEFGGGNCSGVGLVCVKPSTNYHDQLLSESSDEQENYWKARRKIATNKKTRTGMVSRKRCATVISICTTMLLFGCVVVTSIVLWLFFDMRQQTNFLYGEINQVAAGSQGMPEALQKCHVETKELQNNQSDLYSRVINLNSQMAAISQELMTLKGKLNASTATFTDRWVNAKDTVETIETFKSWINELNTSINRLNASQNRLEDDFQTFVWNSSTNNLKEKLPTKKVPNVDVSDFIKDDLKSQITNLSDNLSYINNSLISEIQLMKEEFKKDRVTLENIKSLQNITSRINIIEQELIKIPSLSLIVENLTSQFDSSNIKLKILSEQVYKLVKENSTVIDKSTD